MLSTAWYSSFLSFNAACIFGYRSVWRTTDEVFCPRRTSAFHLLPLGQQQVTKVTTCSRSPARAGHEGMPFPPALLCETVQKKVAKSKTLIWTCCFPVCIQLKSQSPFPPLAAPFCHLHQGRLPQSSGEVTVVAATEQGSSEGRKKLNQIVQALFSQHLEAQPTWKLCLVCVCVINKEVSHSFRPIFHQVKSWPTAKLSPVPADSSEKRQWFTVLCMDISYVFALAYVPVLLHTVCQLMALLTRRTYSTSTFLLCEISIWYWYKM